MLGVGAGGAGGGGGGAGGRGESVEEIKGLDITQQGRSRSRSLGSYSCIYMAS